LLQKLKNKKYNDSVVLAFLECICYIQILVIRQKDPYFTCMSSHFLILAIKLDLVRFGLGAPLHLNYIAYYYPHLHCSYHFASHKKIWYFASSGLTK